MKTRILLSGIAFAAMTAAVPASAAELRFACYQDGVECDAWAEAFKTFEADNPGTTVVVDIVPYKSIVEGLPLQLASGEGPDLARVTDLGGLARYMLDVTPYVSDAARIEEQYGRTLAWTRVNSPDDKGIYAIMDQQTATGPFINTTLFEQAGVAIPGEGATYADWAAAAKEVAEKTQTPYAVAMDRTGHRFAGPAISYGAKYFDADGNPITVDEGYRAFAEQFVAWNNDGTVAKEVWAGAGGATYQDAAKEFTNGSLVMYISGSWQIGRFGRDVGDAFDWQAVPAPCGPGGCTGIPGGAAIAAFKHTKAPEEVGKLLEFISNEDVQAKVLAKTKNIPANQALQVKGIDYENATDAEKAALGTFSSALANFSPVAFQFQGYKNNRAIMNATVTRITQAIVGESTLDEALSRIDADVKEAVAAAQ
ncbi:carbohydrate ABC transporter substrate-binding protein [Aquibium carbonis]|uniref:Carbohydrate ABC transporter substrate-binding protein n=1 Tax=Aquibium carbonis TaxID=2495581 RepID=A0A429YSJ7_9HYPH|nr:ABC transporter substrate-binding protein [Aquibium carbonis]RST84362.1 carbohydrate ABC transporter substrate-binding protein [Aquibium carbonis]